MAYPKIIAVDFDGCLVTNKFPDIGEPIKETISALKAEQDKGAEVILWTCRRDEDVKAAAKWCAENGIHLDTVNENIPRMIEFFGQDTRKIFANEYWDDRAVLMPKGDK
jgi:hydroxymethylpyrimidine pyrophosphatase-like HAD family hydrolase